MSLKARDLFEIYLDWQARTQDLIDDAINNAVQCSQNDDCRSSSKTANEFTDFVIDLKINLCRQILGSQPEILKDREQKDVHEICKIAIIRDLVPLNKESHNRTEKLYEDAAAVIKKNR
jgi:hypothetical protein